MKVRIRFGLGVLLVGLAASCSSSSTPATSNSGGVSTDTSASSAAQILDVAEDRGGDRDLLYETDTPQDELEAIQEVLKEHPDTLIVANWKNVVVRGIQVGSDGLILPVEGDHWGPVEKDESWPDSLILIDAHTHELVHVIRPAP